MPEFPGPESAARCLLFKPNFVENNRRFAIKPAPVSTPSDGCGFRCLTEFGSAPVLDTAPRLIGECTPAALHRDKTTASNYLRQRSTSFSTLLIELKRG